MFVLKKLFKLRDKSGGQSAEKPFLEHLEDFRDLILRVVLTLAITTVACYIFRDTLLETLRRPIEQVWVESEKSKLPETISPDTWEKAKQAAEATANHTPKQRDFFYSQLPEEHLKFYAECFIYYRSALIFKDLEKQKEYIRNIPDLPDPHRDFVAKLLEKKPSATLNARGDVVLMRSLKPTETFMLALKLSIFSGIIISFPLILFFILQFVVPGLKENERKALYPALLIGFGLFLGGAFFCYFSVLPKALDFFFSFGQDMGVENEWRIGEYISFSTQFILIFGFSFELPVVVMTLVKIGLLGYETMRNTRSYAIIGIMIVAAVITPTGDMLTLSMLAVPMIILYEICIWLAYFSHKKELAEEASELEQVRAYRKSLENQADQVEGNHAEEDPHDTLPDKAAPRIVPVPGRIPADADDEFISELDDDDQYDADYEGEGEEIDDGEIEPYDPSEVYTQEDEDNYKGEDTGYEYDHSEIDFNPGAHFEDDFQPASEKDHEQEEKSPVKDNKEEKKDPPAS